MQCLQLFHSIKKRYTKIEKALSRVFTDFGTEDIHLFRLEVKKLRSLLQLAYRAKCKASNLKLHEKLHAFYRTIETIGSLQFQQQGIKGLIQVEYSVLQEPYLSFITNEIDELIAAARKLIKDKKHFAKGKKELLKRLPFKLKPKFHPKIY